VTVGQSFTNSPALTFSLDDHTLAATDATNVALFDLAAMAERYRAGLDYAPRSLSAHAATATGIAVGASDDTVVSADEHGRIVVWTTRPENEFTSSGGNVDTLHFHPTQPWLVVGHDARITPSGKRDPSTTPDVTVYDMATRSRRSTVTGMQTFAVARDGTMAVATSLRIPGSRVELRPPDGGAPIALPLPAVNETGKFGPSGRLAFSPDGRLLAATGTTLRREGDTLLGETTVAVWSVPDRKLITTFPGGMGDPGFSSPPQDLAFSPDGDQLAYLDTPDDAASPGEVVLWDARRHRRIAVLNATGVRGIAFHPRDSLLAVGLKDRVTLWDTSARTVRREILTPTLTGLFSADAEPISATNLAFSADGAVIAARDRNGLALMDTKASATTTFVSVDSVVDFAGVDVDLSPDGRFLALAHGDTRVTVLDLDIDRLITRVCAMLDRPFTDDENDIFQPRTRRPCPTP
jgi:WD40 repeat protein